MTTSEPTTAPDRRDDLAGATDPEPAPFPTLTERARSIGERVADRYRDDPLALLEAAVSLAAVAVATSLVLAVLHPTDLWNDNTPTGGDMGSHLWGPRVLIDHLLPHLRLSGWTPDWYNGFPAYQFYMVVPSLFVVVLTVGLPWWAAVPATLACVALGLAGWARERLHPYRWVLVALAAFLVVLVLPLSYNRSFKVVTVLGLVGLPAACWLCAKLADLPFPIPPLVAGASLLFIFNREPLFENTGNIIGGNFQSTMAGEFAFSISLTFAVLYLGVAARGLRTGRHRALAAALFALAGLCHLIPAFFVLACTAALFVVHPDKARFKWLATMVPVAGLLTAFWVVPFWWRSDYVNDMGWERLPKPTSTQPGYGEFLWPNGLRWLLVAALLGIAVSLVRRYALGMVLALAWAGVAVAFWALPQHRLWNARLLPFMYLSVAVLAAIGVGEVIRVVAAAAAGDARRPMRSVAVPAALLVLAGVFVYVALPINNLFVGHVTRTQVTDAATGEQKTKSSWGAFSTTSLNPASGWSLNNYQGLEEKPAQPPGCDLPGSATPCTTGGWDEYRHLVATMAGLGEDPDFGCGRAFWEYDGTRLGGYGTPMALMMLPYFTDGCIGSQEGLYFESSATVPYHFLMQSELSASGSGPQRKLVYPGFDIDAGVAHLQLLGVKYYLASTTTAVQAASTHRDLTEVAVSGPWHVYEVADAAPVSALTEEPVVLTGLDESQDGWLPMASAWFLDTDQNDVVVAHDGPAGWKRVGADPVPDDARSFTIWARQQLGLAGAIDQVPELPRTKLPANEVSHIEMGQDTISFDVSNPGVPVLVKTSYFPNWEVSGAKGPYRVSPNLMVVIPTGEHVAMHYGRTPVDLVAIGLSLLGVLGLIGLARRPSVAVAPWHPWAASRWVDAIVTIAPAPATSATSVPPPGWSGAWPPDDPSIVDGAPLDHPTDDEVWSHPTDDLRPDDPPVDDPPADGLPGGPPADPTAASDPTGAG